MSIASRSPRAMRATSPSSEYASGGIAQAGEVRAAEILRTHPTAQPGVKSKAAPSRIEGEKEHHHGKEDVGPRPFGRGAGLINPEPEVQHEDDCQHADKTHAEPENERHGKG